ncbi:MAG: GNAT family N-acetyltransferase [Candidatus Micrarchaeia archaeon]|jgi:ribosomal protein S18 acetylase RimI-like enzyme
MRFSRFQKKHLPAFFAMLDAAKGAFKPSWASHMRKVFSQRGCRRCGLSTHAVTKDGELAAVFATRAEVEAFVLYFILVKNEFLGAGIGKKVVARVEKMARKAGAKFIRVDIYTGRPIQAFYEKQGFAVGGRVNFYEEDGDDQTFLYKKL